MNIDKSNIDNNKKYLDSHNVGTYVEEMMSAIMKEKPEEPLYFMMKFIQAKALQIGLTLPIQGRFENPISQNDTKKLEGSRRLSTSKSYDKPWHSVTSRKESTIVNNQNYLRNGEPISPFITGKTYTNCNSSLDEEFKLVVESDFNEVLSDSTNTLNNLKSIRNVSKTKENLLKLITEEKHLKNNEKLNLEKVINEKDEEHHIMDVAVELSEDSELYLNEFKIQSENITLNQSRSEVLVVKHVSQNNNEASVKFNICANCSKIFESNNEVIRTSCERDWNIEIFKGSLIMDDIESASQVNGPRMISDEIDYSKNYVKNSKKKISVSDFETTSKAWPIVEAASESSYKCTDNKTNMINRNFITK